MEKLKKTLFFREPWQGITAAELMRYLFPDRPPDLPPLWKPQLNTLDWPGFVSWLLGSRGKKTLRDSWKFLLRCREADRLEWAGLLCAVLAGTSADFPLEFRRNIAFGQEPETWKKGPQACDLTEENFLTLWNFFKTLPRKDQHRWLSTLFREEKTGVDFPRKGQATPLPQTPYSPEGFRPIATLKEARLWGSLFRNCLVRQIENEKSDKPHYYYLTEHRGTMVMILRREGIFVMMEQPFNRPLPVSEWLAVGEKFGRVHRDVSAVTKYSRMISTTLQRTDEWWTVPGNARDCGAALVYLIRGAWTSMRLRYEDLYCWFAYVLKAKKRVPPEYFLPLGLPVLELFREIWAVDPRWDGELKHSERVLEDLRKSQKVRDASQGQTGEPGTGL